ncbi:unnamed protein product [Rotaria sordida]|uniref:Uncharacterized protein n=1 Tax=Rotaria sordida TaxID=392033 RepID=A0A819BB67_9BILA|nr:unnamed protein product [Rotaria sordida]CAF3795459.1 unnamed protein product [Rotaria sordida]
MISNKSSACSSVALTTSNDQQIRKKKNILKSKDNILKNTNKKKQRITKILSDETSLSKHQTSQDIQTSINSIDIEQKQQNSSTDNLIILLTQGLQSNDSNLLDVSKFIQ